jgi:hypothetical protein
MFWITWEKNILPIFKCLRTDAPGTRTFNLPGPDAMDQTSRACNATLQYAGHVREDYKPSRNDVRSGRSGGGIVGVVVGENCFREEGTSSTCRVHQARQPLNMSKPYRIMNVAGFRRTCSLQFLNILVLWCGWANSTRPAAMFTGINPSSRGLVKKKLLACISNKFYYWKPKFFSSINKHYQWLIFIYIFKIQKL